MTQFNNMGYYVVRRADGRVLADSHVSAYSRRRAVTHVRLEPVDGVPGLYVRIATRELAQVTDRERTEVHDRARAWYVEAFGAPAGVTFVTPEPVVQDDRPDEDTPAGVTNVTAQVGDEDDLPAGVTNGTPETGAADHAPPRSIDDVTLEELREIAQELDLPGRSRMDKAALFAAVYGESED